MRTAGAFALALFLAACTREGDTDQLATARRNLKPVPCGATQAVAAAAGANANPREVYVGDWVVVSVCHLQELVQTADAEQQPITLYVEGVDSGNEAAGIDIDSGTVTFILDRNEKNKALWMPLLYNPLFDPTVTLHISAGIRGDRPLLRVAGAPMTVTLRKIYVDWATWLWLLFLFSLLVTILVWARRSDMLRDGPPADGVRRPYSLPRTQMAFWFILIVLGYGYIWLVTSDRDTIPPSLLALMGISAATALAANAIPARRTGEEEARSRGFWNDLVADERGVVALDRVQIVVWTLILGGIFLFSVVWELAMPELSATLLALMGISSGTYIGFRLPTRSDEQK